MDKKPRRVAIITGASSGIGRLAAKQLAADGWDVIGQGRNPDRCAVALADIEESAAPDTRVAMLRCDLSHLGETAELAQEIMRRTGQIQVLINNAGGLYSQMALTPEGHEATFAGNHLGPFLLTKKLMPILRRTAALHVPGTVRVIATSSSGHAHCAGIDWSDIQHVEGWASGRNYCLAKLYNLLFTLELAHRAAPDRIVAHAMHPGVVNSNFHAHATPEMQRHMRECPGDSPARSAATLAWLASDPSVGTVTGGYFYDMAPAIPSAAAQERGAAQRLWAASEALLREAGY